MLVFGSEQEYPLQLEERIEKTAVMKVTLAILACLGVAGANAAGAQNNTYPENALFLETHQFFLEMIYRVNEPLPSKDFEDLGSQLIGDRTKYKKFDVPMEDFYGSYKAGRILRRGEFYSALNELHSYQTWGLFNFFCYTKSYDTFLGNIAWARINVNEGMFVNALILTVIHHPDLRGFILPPIYEIFPQSFLNSKFIVKAKKFDSDAWNRQIMLEKELKIIYDQQYSTDVIGENRFYLRNWKVWQWWKLMGLDEDWHLEEKTVLRDNIEVLENDPKFKAVWEGVKAYWHPVDYSRDLEIFNDETKLSYFTEDVGWNAYWFYLNLDYRRFLDRKLFKLDQRRNGEFWIYNVQQLMARYYMERLSNGLGEVDELSYYGNVKTGYNPQLITYKGNGFTIRKNYWDVQSYGNVALLNRLMNVENRIFDVINSGKYVTADGVVIDITKPESIEHIGNFMHGNGDIADRKVFGYWYSLIPVFLTGTNLESFDTVPNVLLNPETMLRDPIIYQIFKKIVHVFYEFKNNLTPYTREELIVPGVKIADVEVSNLETYFDLVDIDVSNLLSEKVVFGDLSIIWDKTLLARQLRLNHKPFTFDIKVTSDQVQKVVVRIFIAPDFDENGQKIDLFLNRETIFELDEFAYELNVGENVITRSSKDFSYTIGDPTTYTELYKYVTLAEEGKQDFLTDITQAHCGFPNRLLLPKGKVEGLPMKMFFFISQYTGTHKQFSTYSPGRTCGIDPQLHRIEHRPFGYPFDRKINNVHDFLVPNLYIKPVEIYHMDKFKKYYPNKYEHFGTFDYNF